MLGIGCFTKKSEVKVRLRNVVRDFAIAGASTGRRGHCSRKRLQVADGEGKTRNRHPFDCDVIVQRSGLSQRNHRHFGGGRNCYRLAGDGNRTPQWSELNVYRET